MSYCTHQQNFSSSEELITEFYRECKVVQKGLAGGLRKTMKDGKPIIIEGMHLDPSMDDDNKLLNQMPIKDEESKPLKGDCKNGIKTVSNFTVSQDSREKIKIPILRM